jgi:hypothetical protein
MSRNTVIKRNIVIKAEREVEDGSEPSALIDKQPRLVQAFAELVHPDTRGNPITRWLPPFSTATSR